MITLTAAQVNQVAAMVQTGGDSAVQIDGTNLGNTIIVYSIASDEVGVSGATLIDGEGSSLVIVGDDIRPG